MATASGQPPASPPAKASKAPMTEEKKKMVVMLSFLGFLAVVTGIIYIPQLLGGSKTPVPVAPPDTTIAPGPTPGGGMPPGGMPSGGTPGGEGGAAAPAAPAPAASGAGAQSLVRYRSDPFVQFYTTPVLPEPTPTPIPPLVLPRPERVILPVALPAPSGGNRPSTVLLGLPPVIISRLNRPPSAPQIVAPPRRGGNGGGNASSSGGGDPSPSYNKRLSGVIIGDGVRALLEINTGEEIVTRVVQPGDEVDGVSILNIQRFTEGSRTVTRMLIREKGEERFVELKPLPAAPAGGLAGGVGGAP